MKEKTKLKDSWVWNKSVNEFIRDRVEGFSLNVCAGESPVGDIKVDLDPKDKSILEADMRLLPFESKTFDTVIQDPPWKIGYYKRFRPFFECVRVCKIGGKIIYNAYWIPESDNTELKDVIIRQDREFTNTSVISIFEKLYHEEDYDEKIKEELEEEDIELKELRDNDG